MKQLKWWLFVLVNIFGLASYCMAQSSPLPMLETTANQIITELSSHKNGLKNNSKAVYAIVNRYLLPHVDIQGMARSVLGREAWNKASIAERQQFAQAFTQLVIRTYASPLTEYTDEKIKFMPPRTNSGRFIRINSLIVRSNGKNIPLNYSLVLNGPEWKIYDLTVEGVSLLQSFKSQFAQMLQNSSIKEVISQMKSRRK